MGMRLLEKTTKWSLVDLSVGVRLQFITQKPLDVSVSRSWAANRHPTLRRNQAHSRFARNARTEFNLDALGNLICKKLREKRKVADDAL